MNFARVFNDYDFGGYLIANGVAPFIDGRTELYGEKFFVEHNSASGLMDPENLFRLLRDYNIEATLMRTQSAATKLLDHMDGWQKVYADDIATDSRAQAERGHSAEPAVAFAGELAVPSRGRRLTCARLPMEPARVRRVIFRYPHQARGGRDVYRPLDQTA